MLPVTLTYLHNNVYVYTYVGVCASVCIYIHTFLLKGKQSIAIDFKKMLDSDPSAKHLKERTSLNSIAKTLYTYLFLYKQIMKIIS